MGKKAAKAVLLSLSAMCQSEEQEAKIPRPRLHKLVIKNFRCIGSVPVEIDLDEIVVLVGPNNVGKSSILRAYEVVMSHGSKQGDLSLDDFPNNTVNPNALPEIELQTVVFNNAPGEKWIETDPNTDEMLVRERWTWNAPGKPVRQGWDVSVKNWSEKVPWGAPNVANSNRPLPHRVDAFASPDDQATEILKLLQQYIKDRVKQLSSDDSEDESDYTKLLNSIRTIQKQIVEETQEQVSAVESELSTLIARVFPDYKVEFDAKPEDDLEKSISLFKGSPELRMGPSDGFRSNVSRQGSGARRTLLWTALQIIAEAESKNKEGENERPHVLLMDEPEICLHPSAIRKACSVLYDLPSAGRWQVMITTHAPAFIDFTRDNTTIVRVERNNNSIKGTTIFRPKQIKLGDDDKENLKMLNLCDPYVAEFFFGGRTVIVEGDTEYSAFKLAIESNPNKFKDVHIVRARGKATIASLVKILNHFGSSFSILHDSDLPTTTKKTGELMTNPAWSTNQKILDAVKNKSDDVEVRLLASIPNFELAYLGDSIKTEKPYNALTQAKNKPEVFGIIVDLLESLVDFNKNPPANCIEWSEISNLTEAVKDI